MASLWFLINACGIEEIDLIAIEILENTLKQNKKTLEDVLREGISNELINLSHFSE